MMKGAQRLFVRLLLGVVVIMQLFASGVPFFAERYLSSSSDVAVVSESPQPAPKSLQVRRMTEIAFCLSITVGLIATMAFWAKVEFRWRVDDHKAAPFMNGSSSL